MTTYTLQTMEMHIPFVYPLQYNLPSPMLQVRANLNYIVGLANSWFSFVQISQMFCFVFFHNPIFAIGFSLEVHLLKELKETLKIIKTISLSLSPL